MYTKKFYPNEKGKIEFTKEELNDLLIEVYEEGKKDGSVIVNTTPQPYTITYGVNPNIISTTGTDALPVYKPIITC